jgi:hypothetical protein
MCPFCGAGDVVILEEKERRNMNDMYCRNCHKRFDSRKEEMRMAGPFTDLKDTAEMMASEDYKERFRAEYWQTKIRYEKLKELNTRIEAATCWGYAGNLQEPKHDCPSQLLREQQTLMGEYLHILEVRAIIENIEL